MRFALISDIHGNLNALTAVLGAIRETGAEQIICLGDIVGYGPFPCECLSLVRESCSLILLGNHDAGVAGLVPSEQFNEWGRIALEWTRERLSAEERAILGVLPLSATLDKLSCAHSSPEFPDAWTYVRTWDHAERVMNFVKTTFCCIGHTHIPIVVSANGIVNNLTPGYRHLINPGSVGQPRDGNPRASFALVDSSRQTARIIRVEYDIGATAKAIRQADLPEFLAQRLELGI